MKLPEVSAWLCPLPPCRGSASTGPTSGIEWCVAAACVSAAVLMFLFIYLFIFWRWFFFFFFSEATHHPAIDDGCRPESCNLLWVVVVEGIRRGCCSGFPGNLLGSPSASCIPTAPSLHPSIPPSLQRVNTSSSLPSVRTLGSNESCLPPPPSSSSSSSSLGTYLDVGPRRLIIMRLIVSNPLNRWQRAARPPAAASAGVR